MILIYTCRSYILHRILEKVKYIYLYIQVMSANACTLTGMLVNLYIRFTKYLNE